MWRFALCLSSFRNFDKCLILLFTIVISLIIVSNCLRDPPRSTCSSLHTPSPSPGKHWSFYCLPSSAFSRTSQIWNHSVQPFQAGFCHWQYASLFMTWEVISFHPWASFCGVGKPQVLYWFTYWRISYLLPVFGYEQIELLGIFVCRFCVGIISRSAGWVPEGTTARSDDKTRWLSFVKKLPMVFQKGCPTLYSGPWRVRTAPRPRQQLVSACLGF